MVKRASKLIESKEDFIKISEELECSDLLPNPEIYPCIIIFADYRDIEQGIEFHDYIYQSDFNLFKK